MIIFPWMRVAAGLGLIAVTFGAGWTVNGWRMGQEHASQALQAANAAAQALRDAESARDTLAARLRASDDIHAAQLQGAQDETNRLRDRVAAGTGGLRIAAKCPAVPAVPQASAPASMDPGAGAELDVAARSAYFALRDGIDRAQAQLAACQAQLKARS